MNQNETTVKRIKVITSHAGHARFLAECDEETPGRGDLVILGYIPRRTDIPSPYAYSPMWTVYRWNGRPVIVRETSHKRYEVFAVSGPLSPTDEPDFFECVCEDCGVEERLLAAQADRFITTHVDAKHLATVQLVAR